MEKGLVTADVCVGVFMDLTKQKVLVSQNNHAWLANLNTLLNEIDKQYNENNDILLECCKSILESISKNIVRKLDQVIDDKDIHKTDFTQLVGKAKKCLLEHSSVLTAIEKNEFSLLLNIIGNWAHFLSEVRNKIGEVSHGKLLPKPYQMDAYTALVIQHITDGFSALLIHLFLKIDVNYMEVYKYEKYEEFNDYLDELNPLPNNISYSQALYEQDYDAYAEELDNYLDQQGIEV